GIASEAGSSGPAGDRLVLRDGVAVERHDGAGIGEQAAAGAVAAVAAVAVDTAGAAQAADGGVAGDRGSEDADGVRRERHRDPAAQAVTGVATGREVAAEAASAARCDIAADHRRGDGEIPKGRLDGAALAEAAVAADAVDAAVASGPSD